MAYEPRGKVGVLLDVMKAQPHKVVWSAAEVAATMEVQQGNLPAYLEAVIKHGLLHRLVESGKSSFSLRPFPVITTAAAPAREPWRPPVMNPPRGTSAPIPSLITSSTPPAGSALTIKHEERRTEQRPATPGVTLTEDEIAARIRTANENLNERLRARRGSEIGKRTTSAATASGHEIPDVTSTPEPTGTARPAVANEGGARVASGGCAQLEDASTAEDRTAEVEAASQVTWSMWEDGDLDLYGLHELADGSGHRLPAEALARLRKFIAWMPAC